MDNNSMKKTAAQASTVNKGRKRSSTKMTSVDKTEDAKPTRKARRTSKAASISEDLDDDDPKREHFLARNREAASKCQQKKKKEWTQDLEQSARPLGAEANFDHVHGDAQERAVDAEVQVPGTQRLRL
jgi:hypothetical protein